MRKSYRYLALMLAAGIFSVAATAQSITISGNIRNSATKEVAPAVSVTVKGSSEGSFTDDKGNFTVTTSKKPPFVLLVSSVGYESKEVNVSTASDFIKLEMTPASTLGTEVVVSASRVPQKIMESPVSIERVNTVAIRNAPAANYYDIVKNLKGVDVVNSSMTFTTPTTRGFSGSGNTRFTQIVDGMDNQAPGLNFSVGSIIGLTELDVDNMELLPGASSALYGPGGMNGTLLVTSKSPFKYQGLSFQIKQGIMHTGDRSRSVSPYYNWNLRWAKKISDRFAFKIGSEMIQAKDWLSDDYRNYKRVGTSGSIAAGTRDTDPNYDGVNTYGDETSANLRDVLNGIAGQAPFLAPYINGLPANIPVSRTGYTESEVADPNTLIFKLSGALHYKISNQVEAVLSGYWGTGNTIYTGSERYSLKGLKVGQYKLEFNSKNWFLRGYTTQENSGESHNLTVTTRLFNEAWKPSVTYNANGNPNGGWYIDYGQAYLAAKLSGMNDLAAHNAARAAADQGRPVAGSDQFKAIFDQVRSKPIPAGGLFLDRTDLYMTEGQYNLTDAIKFAEVLVGANWKQYVLNSQGTLFADKPGSPIKINEYGTYVQVSKEVVPDVLRLTASGRYDKNENFAGKFTPRLTALIKLAKDNNLRLSFQTAYRFPSTQQQWIDLLTSNGRLIGGVKALWDKYNMTGNPVYSSESVQAGTPQQVNYTAFKPESVTSYEVGYKSLIAKKLLIDAYGYYSKYKNFLSRRDVIQSKTGNPADLSNRSNWMGYSIVVNSPQEVEAIGWGVSFEYLMGHNFTLSTNLSSDQLNSVPPGFRADFNTPKYRTNITFGNTGFGYKKHLGFSATWRWQDTYFNQSDFIFGDIPAYHTVDAQVSYRIPEAKSTIKLGATNLLNQYYRTAMGNPSIGGLYYVSYGFNIN
jgi:outer membrane receptor protein involved in Fe transport